jgi:hypothetical protein
MGLTRRDVLISGSSGATAVAANFVDTVTPTTAQTAALPQSWDREADIYSNWFGGRGAFSCDCCARGRLLSYYN